MISAIRDTQDTPELPWLGEIEKDWSLSQCLSYIHERTGRYPDFLEEANIRKSACYCALDALRPRFEEGATDLVRKLRREHGSLVHVIVTCFLSRESARKAKLAVCTPRTLDDLLTAGGLGYDKRSAIRLALRSMDPTMVSIFVMETRGSETLVKLLPQFFPLPDPYIL